MAPPLMPNQRWSLDFVSDQLTHGRRFRSMIVVDDFTESLALIADPSLAALHRMAEGQQIIVLTCSQRAFAPLGQAAPCAGRGDLREHFMNNIRIVLFLLLDVAPVVVDHCNEGHMTFSL